jgi:hypothetical protein
LLHKPIDGRQFEFSPYGIAVTKKQARGSGANPIWYLDITPGHDWLTQPVDTLVEQAIATGNFNAQPIARLAPFIEQMGTSNGARGRQYRKEFWWEREWRKVGNLMLPNPFIVICPEADIAYFRHVIDNHELRINAAFIAADWGLEQIIANLAGFSRDDIEIF